MSIFNLLQDLPIFEHLLDLPLGITVWEYGGGRGGGGRRQRPAAPDSNPLAGLSRREFRGGVGRRRWQRREWGR